MSVDNGLLFLEKKIRGHDPYYDFRQICTRIDALEVMSDKFDRIINNGDFDNLLKQLQSSRIKFVTEEKSEIYSVKESITEKLISLVNELLDNYDDIIDRLDIFCSIKHDLNKLKSIINKETHKYYFRTCILLHDALAHAKSECITKEQIEVIRIALIKLKQENIEKDQWYTLDTLFVENNLDCVPDLDTEE